jgi:hypothetical protein
MKLNNRNTTLYGKEIYKKTRKKQKKYENTNCDQKNLLQKEYETKKQKMKSVMYQKKKRKYNQ